MDTKARLIGPDALEPDAVLPQCLDNQYLTDDVYASMVRYGLDYSSEQVREIRSQNFNAEFMRSVLYSSQVVVQRAALINNEFLQAHFAEDRTNRANQRAFAQLVRVHGIVPFLLNERSLADEVGFDVRSSGLRRLAALLEEIGDDITCVRLAVDDRANQDRARRLSTGFGAGISRLRFMDRDQRNSLAADLFENPALLHADGGFDAYSNALDTLVEFANRHAAENDGKLNRNDVYRSLLCHPGDMSVVEGRLHSRDADHPFHFELKKYVDLVYNTNLPDRLRRYTFTPAGLPSRLALQDDAGTEYSFDQLHGLLSDEELLESIRRTFMARVQRPMNLPFLSRLQISDVEQIRCLPEWDAFARGQADVLRNPLQLRENIEDFQLAFNEFQSALSSWYLARYGKQDSTEQYCSYVSLGLSLAGKVVVAGSIVGGAEKAVAGFAADQALGHLPERIKRFAAKLMVTVYDVGNRRIDKNRSYSIELMQSDVELARDDVVDLLRAATSSHAGSVLPSITGQTADQGIQ